MTEEQENLKKLRTFANLYYKVHNTMYNSQKRQEDRERLDKMQKDLSNDEAVKSTANKFGINVEEVFDGTFPSYRFDDIIKGDE